MIELILILVAIGIVALGILWITRQKPTKKPAPVAYVSPPPPPITALILNEVHPPLKVLRSTDTSKEYKTNKAGKWKDEIGSAYAIKQPRFEAEHFIRRDGKRFSVRFSTPKRKRDHGAGGTSKPKHPSLLVEVEPVE